MAEAAAGKVVVLDLAHQAGFKRNPLGVAVGRGPAARTAWSFDGKTFAAHERIEDALELFAFFVAEAGTEADVVEFVFVVVEAEQQRTDLATFLRPTEASNNAIGGTDTLDLDHSVALTGAVFAVKPLGDHAIEPAARSFLQPPLSDSLLSSGRPKLQRPRPSCKNSPRQVRKPHAQ